MASPLLQTPGARPSWVQVLDTIQQALDQAISQAGNPPPPADRDNERSTDWQPALQRMEERLQQLQGIVQRAEQSAAETDALLAAAAGALAQWQAAARQNLAEGGGLSVR